MGVEVDLGFEGVEGIEADLVADAGDEADVEGAAVEVAGEVEEVDFEVAGGGGEVDGGAEAEVGDAWEDFGVEDDVDGVDAGRGELFGFEGEVGGGEAEFPAELSAEDDIAEDGVGAAEEGGGGGEVAGFDGETDAGTADGFAVDDDWGDGVDGEAGGLAHGGEGGHVAGAGVAEGPVGACGDAAEGAGAADDLADEVFGREGGEGFVEGEDEDGGCSETLHDERAVASGGEEAGCGGRADDGGGVAVEREDRGGTAGGIGGVSRGAEDLLMAEMDAVEEACGEVERAGQGCEVCDGVQGLHGGRRWVALGSGSAETADVAEGEDLGEDVLGGGFLEFLECEGAVDGEVAAAGAAESGHVAEGAETFADVVAVGTDVEAFAADDAEVDVREGDVFDLVVEDGDEAWFAFDDHAFAGEFVERYPVFFDGADHGRHLIEVAAVVGEGVGDLGGGELGDGAGFEGFAFRVLSGSGRAEAESAFVFLFFGHEEVLDAGGFADDEDEEARGHGVESPAVADFSGIETAASDGDDIVRGHVLTFIDEEDAVDFRFRGTGFRRQRVLHQGLRIHVVWHWRGGR